MDREINSQASSTADRDAASAGDGLQGGAAADDGLLAARWTLGAAVAVGAVPFVLLIAIGAWGLVAREGVGGVLFLLAMPAVFFSDRLAARAARSHLAHAGPLGRLDGAARLRLCEAFALALFFALCRIGPDARGWQVLVDWAGGVAILWPAIIAVLTGLARLGWHRGA